MEFGSHFQDMMNERNIPPEWVDKCVHSPDRKEDHPDGTTHFIKQIPEFGNRWLRVVINVATAPHKGVTVFFDRRLRREHESKS